MNKLEYGSPAAYSDDVLLCLENATVYNTRGTYIYLDANALKRIHKKVDFIF